MLRELELRGGEYAAYEVVSVFIGGGTPSLAPGEWIAELMERIRERFRLADGAEVTIEGNPGTADGEKFAAYRAAGVNRLSIGLQSALDEELRLLGRAHTFRQFEEAYRAAREAGFRNVNVDLMSALPGQSRAAYQKTLRAVLDLEPLPEHISAYSLIVEEGTPFGELLRKGELSLPDEDTDRQMYADTARELQKKGFRRYEVSNYARAGYECRHNCGCWQRREYAGFGLGAASLVRNVRFSNTRDLAAYLEMFGKGREGGAKARRGIRGAQGGSGEAAKGFRGAQGGSGEAEKGIHGAERDLGETEESFREAVQELTQAEQMEEFMFLGLRLTEGVSSRQFRETFHVELPDIYGRVLERSRKEGLLRLDSVEARTAGETADLRIRLTDRGVDLSNYVLARFLL